MSLTLFFVLVVMLGGAWSFSFIKDHLLVSLLSLEFMVLIIFFLFVVMLSVSNYYYSLIYLIISACEGALGLSILIVMSRSCGGDFMKTLGGLVI